MLTKEQEERVRLLYIEYQEDIKPLTFYVERKYHKFPKSFLKEFRDVFDHISRCYERDATEQYKEENLKKAGKDHTWLNDILRRNRSDRKDALLVTVDGAGHVVFLRKETP